MLSTSAIKENISSFLKVPMDKLQDERVLTELVSESFILVEMVMFLQDELSVRLIQDDIKSVRTVGDLIAVFQKKSQ